MNKKPNVSVIVVNYNNSQYLIRSLNSLTKQTYKNIEIILVDDQSSDNSIKLARKFFINAKFKNYKIILNKKKTKFGSYNQMNCIMAGLNLSKGNLIFFLDSDDFFKRSKIKEVINFLKKDNKVMITFDLAYQFFSKKNKKKFKIRKRNKNIIPWPSFPSQSTIAIKKNYLKKILKKIIIKKYPDIWLDFRILAKSYYDLGEVKYLNKYLTYYQQHSQSESHKFQKYNRNWWKRRKEAHEFIKKYVYRNQKKIFSLDYYLTNLVNKFL